MRSVAGLAVSVISLVPAAVATNDPGVGAFDEPLVEASAIVNDSSIESGVSQSGTEIMESSGLVSVGVSRLDGCTFVPSLAPSEVFAQLAGYSIFPTQTVADDTQRYTMIICPADGDRELFYEFWPEGGLPPERVTRFLGREALARTQVPRPEPQGAPDGVDIPYLVNLPNWWWLDDWQPASGTAALEAPNPVSVTALLTPTTATWAVEGYGEITCGQGKPWTRDSGLRDTDPKRCGMTFNRHAPPEGLRQTVTVSYGVSFVCAPAALCDQLPTFAPIEVATTTSIDIIQVRGVLLS